jgi:phenylpropionate dioxygenase-like ring-hydroxylating dioxygenase large terminal subunit
MPTDVYVSQERYALEQSRLFRGRPVPIALTAQLPDRNTHLVVEDYGPSLLLTRDGEGRVHAFHNICSHRAIKLCQVNGVTKGGLIVCPYHAWTYDLKGKLKALPRPDVFPGLDKSEHGLISLECHEAGGMVWVNLDRNVQANFSAVDGPLRADLDAIGLGQQKIYKQLRIEVKANWKLIIDSFSENYHVTRLHAESLKGMFVDRLTHCEMVEEHLRVMSARAGFEQEGEGGTFEQFRKDGVLHYTIIPGALVITSPSYINVMLMAPQAVDRTIVNYFMLVDALPQTEKGIAHYEKSLALMTRLTVDEDFRMAELGAIGAASGERPFMTVGGMEKEIITFHASVNAILGI